MFALVMTAILKWINFEQWEESLEVLQSFTIVIVNSLKVSSYYLMNK